MHIWLTISGFIVAFMTVSIGGAGGGIYVGLLVAFFHVSPVIAASTSLATAIPTAIFATYSNWRVGNLRFDLGKYIFIGGMIGAAMGSTVAPYIPTYLYTRGMGALLVVMTFAMLLKKRSSAAAVSEARNLALGGAAGLLGGFLSGVSGISGSTPITAALLLLGCRVMEATGTSLLVLIGIAIVGFVVHASNGEVDWSLLAWLSAGTALGGFTTPFALSFVDRKKLEIIFKPLVVGITGLMGAFMLLSPPI